MPIIPQKRCSKCKTPKLIGEFSRDRSRKDGLHRWCRQCSREASQRWKSANPNRVCEMGRHYREANPEKERERSQRYYEANRDKVRERQRRYYEANRDKTYAKTHRRRARKRGNGGSYTVQEWQELCGRQAHRCACCGEKKKLTIDHVLPVSMGGTGDIANIQALCDRCNKRKGAQCIDYRV